MQPLSPAFIDQLRFNEAGLIPAVAQDWLDGAVPDGGVDEPGRDRSHPAQR